MRQALTALRPFVFQRQFRLTVRAHLRPDRPPQSIHRADGLGTLVLNVQSHDAGVDRGGEVWGSNGFELWERLVLWVENPAHELGSKGRCLGCL